MTFLTRKQNINILNEIIFLFIKKFVHLSYIL